MADLSIGRSSEIRDQEIAFFREEGRKAKRAGIDIAHMPGEYFPHVGARPLFQVDPGQEWLLGWREQDALGMTPISLPPAFPRP